MNTFVCYCAMLSFLLIGFVSCERERERERERASISFEAISGRYHNQNNSFRLDTSYQAILPSDLWKKATYSSGLYLDFTTDQDSLFIISNYIKHKNVANMNNIAVNGIDLFVHDSVWKHMFGHYNRDNDTLMYYTNGKKEFRLYFPLYNSLKGIEIYPKVIVNKKEVKKVLFYGTSITQGASASSSGMSYPSIIGRNLDVESINLGFSGLGHFTYEIAELICDVNPDIIVIDCVPNCTPDMILVEGSKFMEKIKSCLADTPVIFVESSMRESASYLSKEMSVDYVHSQNQALKELASMFISENIYYISSEQLSVENTANTIDGTHLNTIGMTRLAEVIGAKIDSILAKN